MSSASVAETKRTLRQHLPALREQYGVESLALFGSVVRGTHEPDSDVDVLVTSTIRRACSPSSSSNAS